MAPIMVCCQTAASHYLNQHWRKVIGIHPCVNSEEMYKKICQLKLFRIKLLFFYTSARGHPWVWLHIWTMLIQILWPDGTKPILEVMLTSLKKKQVARHWQSQFRDLTHVMSECYTEDLNLPTRIYRKTSSISRTKSQTLIVSCILLQLSSLNPLKPGVKLRMKM